MSENHTLLIHISLHGANRQREYEIGVYLSLLHNTPRVPSCVSSAMESNLCHVYVTRITAQDCKAFNYDAFLWWPENLENIGCQRRPRWISWIFMEIFICRLLTSHRPLLKICSRICNYTTQCERDIWPEVAIWLLTVLYQRLINTRNIFEKLARRFKKIIGRVLDKMLDLINYFIRCVRFLKPRKPRNPPKNRGKSRAINRVFKFNYLFFSAR